LNILKDSVSQKFNECKNGKTDDKPILRMPLRTTIGRRGTRDQVQYSGTDSRLENGNIYKDFANVLRIVRPDLAEKYPAGKLYNKEAHGGNKAEDILSRYVPEIYKDLSRIRNPK
ncbi:hypothetical protein ACFLYN_06765, partial [Chloroflexota bacterium]